jgi:CHASE2 domain-containing sensor protein
MPTGWVGYAEKPAGQCDIAGPIGIGEEAVVSNAVETVGQHVDQKAADELVDIVEVVRVGSGERAIGIDTGALGIESFRIGGTTIPTDKRGRAILHFAPSQARYISASDVLDPAFDPAKLRGQVMLLGVAGAGIAGLRQTALGLVRAVDLHAQLIESILFGDLLRRPPFLEWFELAAALAAGLAVIWLLHDARPLLAVGIAVAIAAGLGVELVLSALAICSSTAPSPR